MIKPTLTLLASALIMIAVSAQAAHNKKTTPAPKNPSTQRIHIPLHSYPNGVQKNGHGQSSLCLLTTTGVKVTNLHNTQYFAELELGSAKQTFTAILDTGSSNIWVPASSCTSPACSNKASFNPQTSQTFTSRWEPLNIRYGRGIMSGYVGYDTVTFGGYTVENQGVGLATELAADFEGAPFDGIFGLAYQTISSDHVKPWIDTAVEQGVIPKASFSFYLSNSPNDKTSRLIIGEPDQSYYQGDIHWQPLKALAPSEPTGAYYNITFDGISSGEEDVPLSCQSEGVCHAIVDSGTSLIIGPAQDIQQILETVSVNPDCSNVQQLPDISITIGGKALAVPPEVYVVKQQDWFGSKVCRVGLEPSDEDFWIFGDAFMRAFYVVFDKANKRVGFAQLTDALQTRKELKKLYKLANNGQNQAQVAQANY